MATAVDHEVHLVDHRLLQGSEMHENIKIMINTLFVLKCECQVDVCTSEHHSTYILKFVCWNHSVAVPAVYHIDAQVIQTESNDPATLQVCRMVGRHDGHLGCDVLMFTACHGSHRHNHPSVESTQGIRVLVRIDRCQRQTHQERQRQNTDQQVEQLPRP